MLMDQDRGPAPDERWLSRSGLFTNVLKKFFTGASQCENNSATDHGDAMKDAMKTLLSHTPKARWKTWSGSPRCS